jgi:hypothetical protein
MSGILVQFIPALAGEALSLIYPELVEGKERYGGEHIIRVAAPYFKLFMTATAVMII